MHILLLLIFISLATDVPGSESPVEPEPASTAASENEEEWRDSVVLIVQGRTTCAGTFIND